MKKTRLLLAMLVMLVAASGYAQDSYREAVKEYWAIYDKDYVSLMDSIFKSSNTLWFESGDLDLDQLTDRYLKERLIDFIADNYFMLMMKELGVSEAALRENAALVSSPAGKTSREHMQQLSKVLKSELISIMEQDSLKVINGDTSDPIQIKTGIDPGYAAKFKEIMYDDMVNVSQAIFNQYANLASMIFKDHPDEMAKIQDSLAGPKAWIAANLPAIAVNCAYGIITEDDLDFAAKMRGLDTHKLLGLLPMNTVDMMSVGYGIMGDYIEWMENHGAVTKEYMKDIIHGMFNKENDD